MFQAGRFGSAPQADRPAGATEVARTERAAGVALRTLRQRRRRAPRSAG